MRVPAGASRTSCRILFLTLAVTAIFLVVVVPNRAQVAPKPVPVRPQQGNIPRKASPVTDAGKAVDSRPSGTPQVLQQLNSAL